jgi:hypothetical protein
MGRWALSDYRSERVFADDDPPPPLASTTPTPQAIAAPPVGHNWPIDDLMQFERIRSVKVRATRSLGARRWDILSEALDPQFQYQDSSRCIHGAEQID